MREKESRPADFHLTMPECVLNSRRNPQTVVFFGTSEVSVACLQAFLADKDLTVILVITKEGSPLERFAKASGLTIRSAAKITSELNTELTALSPDIFAVVDFGMILPQTTLDIPSKGAYNLHFSLLPRYRGASPVQSAILAGERVSGVSVIKMSAKMDEGALYAAEEVEIADLRADEVFARMLAVGAPLFVKTVKNPVLLRTQEESQATYCHKIRKEDGLIKPILEPRPLFLRKINGFYPWPGVYFQHERFGLLKILRARASDASGNGLFVQNKKLFLALADGTAEILEIQRAGRRAMSGEEFARGMH